MRRTFHLASIGCMLFALLSTAVSANAQTMSRAQCQAECKQVVDTVNAELTTARLTIAKQEVLIKTLQEDKQLAAAAEKELQAKIDALTAQLTEVRVTQGGLQEKNRVILESNVQLLQQVAKSRDDTIALQSKVIEQLAKSIKRSSLEKLVDTLPSIAGIIAIALTHR